MENKKNDKLDFEVIERPKNKERICNALTNYFSRYSILKVKYSNFYIFVVSIYLDYIGEIRLNINTRFNKFEFCSIKFIDSNVFNVEEIQKIYEVVEYAKNVNSLDLMNLIEMRKEV